MFGNLPGWIISFVLACGMSLGLAWSARPMRVTPPTNDPVLSAALTPISLNTSGLGIATHEPRDAGEAYRAAVAAYQQNHDLYEDFRRQPTIAKLPALTAIDAIVKAAHCSSATLFRDRPIELINYRIEHPSVESLKTLGNMAIAAGLLHKANLDYDQAQIYIAAGFELGAKLFAERITFEEMGAGLGLMQGAAMSLESVAKAKGDTGLSERAAQFIKDADDASTRFINCYKIVGGIDENYVGAYTGDIFKIAGNSTADPMWRVEAIKHIGHYQYDAINKIDQISAKRVLQKMAQDSAADPVIQTAAIAARDLTLEDHRNTR